MAIAAIAVTFGGAASAQTMAQKDLIDNAKGAGIVGEQWNGLLAYRVPTADPVLQAAIATTNASRLARYSSEAAAAMTSTESVGQRLFDGVVRGRMCRGHWWRNRDGVWALAAPFHDPYGRLRGPAQCDPARGPYPQAPL